MIVRIVKLTFEAEKTDTFLTFFETIKHDVNNFPGCLGMKLLRDKENPNIIFTYSHWSDEASLNSYRLSGKFSEIWPTIKPWFAARAEAWTTSIFFDGFRQ
jgi:autoinducer 2-degrading protein